MMQNSIKGAWFMCVVVVMSMSLTACESTGSNNVNRITNPFNSAAEENLSPTQKKLRERADQYNNTVFQAATTAVLVGAIAGYMISGDLKGAVVGAGGGALAGGLAGSYVASKRKQFQSENDVLASVIADVRARNDSTKDMIVLFEDIVTENNAKIAQVNEQYKNGLISKDQAEQELVVVELDRKEMEKVISRASKDQKEFVAAKADLGGDDAKMESLDNELDALSARINQMNDLSSKLGSSDIS